MAQVCRNGNLTSVPTFFSSSKMPGVEVQNPEGGDDDMAVVNLLPPGHVPSREIVSLNALIKPAGYVWSGVG